MNPSSTPTPEPESTGTPGAGSTSKQQSFAYRSGRKIRRAAPRILGLVILLVVISYVSHRFLNPADARLIAGGTLACIFLVGIGALIWWCGDRVERYFQWERVAVSAPTPQKGQSDWWDWKTILMIGFVAAVMRRADIDVNPRIRPEARQVQQSVADGQARGRRLQATLSYWQSAVASLHQLRFQIPSGDQATGEVVHEMVQRLSKLTDRAKVIPQADVDQDLATMARRHLTIDDRVIQIKAAADALMKQEKLPADTVAVSQRIAEWQQILARIQTDPSILDRIPPGEERTLLENALELEWQRVDQRREIEIMQAVLQERYRGTRFPLPEIDP